MKRKAFHVLGLLLGLGAGVGFILLLMATKTKPKRRPKPDTTPVVEVITVSPRSYDAVVTGFGVVRPTQTLPVVSEVAGRVMELGPGVAEGALVEKDSLLFRIDDAPYRVEIQRLEAQIASLDAQSAEMQLQNDADGRFLGIEQEVLKLAEKEYSRLLELSADGSVSQSQLEGAQTRVQERKLTVERRRAARTSFETRKSVLEAAKRAAMASLGGQKILLGKTTVKAPYRCRIMDLAIRTHQVVGPGAAVMSVFAVGAPTEISVPIESRHMPALFNVATLKRGTPPWAQVRLEVDVSWVHFGQPYKLTGRLVRMAAQIDPNTRTLTAIIELPGPESRAKADGPRGLLPGAFVRVEIHGRTFQNVLVLPAKVLESPNTLHVVREGRFHSVRVEPIVALGDDVVLPADGALPTGSKVVTTEVPGAFEGTPVRIAKEGGLGK
jgi:multidrug efflux pump subunit AcrA (membrane-fusion protein)